jgi:transcriptional regulator with XRE-family HTH domain
MGTTTFEDRAGGKSARDAYQKAVEEANAYSGHQDGYSGDIQTVAGYREVEGPKPDSVGEVLKSARKAAGFTQAEAAGAMGMSAATLSKIERGVPTPRTQVTELTVDKLVRYATDHGKVSRNYYDAVVAFGEGESRVAVEDLLAAVRGNVSRSALNAFVSDALDNWTWLEKWGPCACVTLREPTENREGSYLFFGRAAC